jgi:hypothetical protein
VSSTSCQALSVLCDIVCAFIAGVARWRTGWNCGETCICAPHCFNGWRENKWAPGQLSAIRYSPTAPPHESRLFFTIKLDAASGPTRVPIATQTLVAALALIEWLARTPFASGSVFNHAAWARISLRKNVLRSATLRSVGVCELVRLTGRHDGAG